MLFIFSDGTVQLRRPWVFNRSAIFRFLHGDVNVDSNVNLADAVAIMQYLSNPSKFPLLVPDYADVTGNRDGVTLIDALYIQKKLLGI